MKKNIVKALLSLLTGAFVMTLVSCKPQTLNVNIHVEVFYDDDGNPDTPPVPAKGAYVHPQPNLADPFIEIKFDSDEIITDEDGFAEIHGVCYIDDSNRIWNGTLFMLGITDYSWNSPGGYEESQRFRPLSHSQGYGNFEIDKNWDKLDYGYRFTWDGNDWDFEILF